MDEINEVCLEVRDLLRRAHPMGTDALLRTKGTPCLVRRKHIHKNLRRLRRCTLVLIDDGKRLTLEAFPLGSIPKEAQRLARQFLPVRDGHNGTAVAEECVDILEIEHLVADDDRLAVCRRFEDVVPAVRNQAAADVDHITKSVDAPELADRVENDDVLAALGSLLQVLAGIDGKARLVTEVLDFDRTQYLTRCNDQPHIRLTLAHGGKRREYQLLLAAMG